MDEWYSDRSILGGRRSDLEFHVCTLPPRFVHRRKSTTCWRLELPVCGCCKECPGGKSAPLFSVASPVIFILWIEPTNNELRIITADDAHGEPSVRGSTCASPDDALLDWSTLPKIRSRAWSVMSSFYCFVCPPSRSQCEVAQRRPLFEPSRSGDACPGMD